MRWTRKQHRRFIFNMIDFIKGRKECWECGGTGQSLRGYGDSSPCGTCGETGYFKISRFLTVFEKVVMFVKQIRKNK